MIIKALDNNNLAKISYIILIGENDLYGKLICILTFYIFLSLFLRLIICFYRNPWMLHGNSRTSTAASPGIVGTALVGERPPDSRSSVKRCGKPMGKPWHDVEIWWIVMDCPGFSASMLENVRIYIYLLEYRRVNPLRSFEIIWDAAKNPKDG